ncbi:hypothetical protein QOZ88_01470 [Blastococcus sp. BMG 814]|uniref:PEP-CTERM protein-sorting domain-containing protein n=1 Tax=Blastococcus carthaginiensis TaxID=3050034 RepID=A0ABT9I6V2_9ACTN|nr:hypothetical protein [Blastococcus carthaginiensis]MDP5181294.1 hypothetical protein [Blastococcus carthaginiensis]
METLLAIGLGVLVVVLIVGRYVLLARLTDRRKKRRDARGG